MPGKSQAVSKGKELQKTVVELTRSMGLECRTEVKVGRRIWGPQRRIDVVLTEPKSKLKLGLECKFQGTTGTAEEKIPATIEDIKAWPIRGLVVIDGPGFSDNMIGYLIATGVAVEFKDLADWLKLYFGLDA